MIERQVAHLTPPRRRPARRRAHHARQARAASASRSSSSDVVAQGHRAGEPAARAARGSSSTSTCPSGLCVDGDLDRLAQVVVEPAHQRRQVHAAGRAASRVRGRARTATARADRARHGQGIAPELLPRLFDPFVQGGHRLDRAQGGLGLGLAIVRGIVARPRRRGHARRAKAPGRAASSRCGCRATPPAGAVARVTPRARRARPERCAARILVVDDNEDAAEMLARALARRARHRRRPSTARARSRSRASSRPRRRSSISGCP